MGPSVVHLSEVGLPRAVCESFEANLEAHYGLKLAMERILRLGRGDTNLNNYYESVTKFTLGGKQIVLHEYLDTFGGLPTHVDLIESEHIISFPSYMEAEQEAMRRFGYVKKES